jgi:hypothetical protein
MIEAKETSIICSMMDELKVLKKRVEEMEERLQTLTDMHSEFAFEVQDDYLVHLDKLEENGEFEEFTDIRELRQRIEKAEH